MKFLLRTLTLLIGLTVFSQTLYTEKYRPQIHPSPSSGFMGDPNGPIKYDGKYHFYWWGHHSSDDMVNWTEETKNVLYNTPGGFGNWSGCMVVDKNNNSGLGTIENPAWLAFYTLNNNSNGVQQQAVSVGGSPGSFFNYYGIVVPNNTPDFRDPQVFWHEESSKWIMVVTKPIDRGIEFYSSADLLNWTYMSTFSGHGAIKELWEVPDLFQLPVNGSDANKKWVLTCGMGPNKMQYWVGDFNGTTFTLANDDNLMTGAQVPGILFEDFETGFDGWTIEGNAFGSTPVNGDLPDQMKVSGWTGGGYVNSYHGGDASTGKATSSEFTISKPFVNFQIGGGNGVGLAFNIIVDGAVVGSAKAFDSAERLVWRGIDIRSHLGKTAKIELVDEATGGWGHILVDHIVFSDVSFETGLENANWADWGYDFYAGKSYRNYDEDDERKIWIAWMGNWTYAQNVPTDWKGCESIPRELELINDGLGYQLKQRPIVEMQTLRNNSFSKSNFSVNGNLALTEYTAKWNVYELKATFEVNNSNQDFGIKLAQGETQEFIIGYNASTSKIYFDRRKGPYNYNFRYTLDMPVKVSDDGKLDLHIFIDQSSVEILAEDYRYSMTALFFNEVSQAGISFFSKNGSTSIESLEIFDLNSILNILPEQVERPYVEPEILSTDQLENGLFPNPVKPGGSVNIPYKETINYVELINLEGNRVSVLQPTGDNSFFIPSWLSSGVYVINGVTNQNTISTRILVQ